MSKCEPVDLIQPIADVSAQIAKRVNELRPLTARIACGGFAPHLLESNNRLQNEISSLDKQREALRAQAKSGT
jgi:cell division protein FtsB